VPLTQLTYPCPAQALANQIAAGFTRTGYLALEYRDLGLEPELEQERLTLQLRLLPQSPLQLWQQFSSELLISSELRMSPEALPDWHLPGQVFTTSIALRLAPILGRTAPDLAQDLISTQNTCPSLPGKVPPLPLFAHRNGWLYGIVPDPAQAAWLQALYQLPRFAIAPDVTQPDLPMVLDTNFSRQTLVGSQQILLGSQKSMLGLQLTAQLQYAHARCCSLLRLASSDPSLDPSLDYCLAPQLESRLATEVSWLDSQQQLWLQDPREKNLLALLAQFPASLSADRCWRGNYWGETWEQHCLIAWPASTRHLIQVLSQWVEAFEQFYRHCRIFSEIKTQQPALALARLGLIAILQKIFIFLNETLFNQPALFYL
jgi:DALR anticodon binding domain